MIFCNNKHTQGAQCYLQISLPYTLLDWHSAYKEDQNQFNIIKALLVHKLNDIPENIITTVNKGYKQHLARRHVDIVADKLILCKPVSMSFKYIIMIITPRSVWRTLFDHFHAGPSGDHMGTYKILFPLKTRFFWPRMNNNIKYWISQCNYCIACTAWRTRKSELNVSWPITVPVQIIHVDLWFPGATVNAYGKKGYLMNSMCDNSSY